MAAGGGRVSSAPRSTWRHRGLRRRTGAWAKLRVKTAVPAAAWRAGRGAHGGEREPRAAAESSSEVGGARQRQARTAAEGEAPAGREPQVDCGPCHGARGGETRAWGAARGRVGRVARETFAGRGGRRRTLTGTLWPRAPRPRVWAPCGRPQSRRGVERPEGQAGLQTERAGVRGSA